MTRRIRIPNSATRRGGITFAKLLSWVTEPATTGFDFEGRLLRPGQQIDESELWPSEDWPEVPVLLECAGITEVGWGHRRSVYTYILWRYERDRGEWREIARTTGTSSEWCCILGPIARSLVVGEIPARPKCEIVDLAEQLVAAIEELVLRRLTDADCMMLLSHLHELLAAVASRRLDKCGQTRLYLETMPKRKRDPEFRNATKEELSRAAAILGSVGGRKRYQNISREYLSEIGRRGAQKRWASRNKQVQGAAA
jgi:hypothetical protein